MRDTAMPAHANVYANAVTGATPNPLMPTPDAVDEAFAEGANRVLARAVELARVVVGAHQAAAAVMVDRDWSTSASSSRCPRSTPRGATTRRPRPGTARTAGSCARPAACG
jgi:hypothetical protein